MIYTHTQEQRVTLSRLCKVRSCCVSQKDQADFKQMLVPDESFDFPDLTTFHGDIITLSPMTNSNVLPSFEHFKLHIKKRYPGCSPYSPQHKFYLLWFWFSKLYIRFWQPASVLQSIIFSKLNFTQGWFANFTCNINLFQICLV